jgi:hypothetical protein
MALQQRETLKIKVNETNKQNTVFQVSSHYVKGTKKMWII